MDICTHIDLHLVKLLPKPLYQCVRCRKEIKNPSRWIHYGEHTSLERTINGYIVSNFEKIMLDGFQELVDPNLRDIEFN